MYYQNNIMDFILSNIGQNKVNVPIVTNEYEETHPYMEETSRFNEIENIIDIYKSSKVCKPVSPKRTQLSSFNSLIYCILEFIDNTISLHSDDFKLEKVEQFKKQLNSKIDLGPKKLFGYDRDCYHEFLKNENIQILNWLCHFLKNTIVVKSNVTGDITLFGLESVCIVIEENINSQYILTSSKDSTSKWKEEKQKLLASRYTPEKLNSMLIKDLKELAKDLEISLFKTEDGKKKNYLKNELKDMIVKSLQ
jgi:hypothetical protein